jgi:hypothetical protein
VDLFKIDSIILEESVIDEVAITVMSLAGLPSTVTWPVIAPVSF